MSNMTAVKLNPDIYIKDLRQIYITSNPTLNVNTAAGGEPSDGSDLSEQEHPPN